MKTQLTIGISFKNPGEYFQLALQSVFAQTFSNWELVLMDDGSTDCSLALAKSIKDERVRVYSDGESRGLNVRLNQMIHLAQTPYFFRMDADDIMHPQRLEKQYQVLLQHDEDTVIGTGAYSINNNSHVVGLKPSRRNQKSGFDARHSFLHPTVAASTSWFCKNLYSDYFIYNRAQDAELWCRTTNKTKFINLPEPLIFYREHGTSSFSNYIGTSSGLLHLIYNEFNQPRQKCVYLFTRELLKLWIVFILVNIFSDFFNYLTFFRYKLLSHQEMEDANVNLAIINQQQLPLD